MSKAPLIINDLRGGMSDEHPAKLGEHQVAYAQNVDFYNGWLGGRRNGSSAPIITATASYQLHRHQPTSSPVDDRLWLVTATGGFVYYDATPLAYSVSISPADTFSPVNGADFASLHGKLFIACDSNVSRLHVFDGTTLRRTGMSAPAAAPGVANTGSGSFLSTRYYRVRFVEMSGSTVIRRSEASAVTTFSPSGSGLSARVTKPTTVSEGETHWELEESIDNANFYRIARTIVGTTTYDDSLVATAVATTGVLSDDSGDNLTLPSARWLTVDDDRLIYAGNFEDATLDARVGWTPLGSQTGVGNDERAPLDIGSYIDIDGRNGGKITGVRAFERKVFVFKESGVYTLLRTGNSDRAYVLGPVISRTVGALPFSIAEGLDSTGQACLYFTDRRLGMMRYGVNGLEHMMPQMQKTWRSAITQDLTFKTCHAIYYPDKGQYWLYVVRGGNAASIPNERWVLDRISGGIAIHTLPEAIYASEMWQNMPHHVGATTIIKCDDSTATADSGTAFRAYIRTRAYQPTGLLLKAATTMAAVETTPHSGVTLTLKTIRNYGIENRSVTTSLTATSEETSGAVTSIIRLLDNGYLSEALALQFELGDATAVSVAAWQLHQLVLNLKAEGSSA